MLPPGPKGRRLRNYWRRLTGYAEFMEQLHEEYGDIVYFRLPFLKCCAVFDRDLAQDALVAQAPFFRPWALGGREPNKLLEYGCLPVHHGEEHRWRSELMKTAFAENRLPAYAEAVGEHALRLRARLRRGQVIDLRPEVERYTWDALAQVVLGREIEGRHGLHIGRLLKAADLLDLLPFGQLLKKLGPKPPTAVLDGAIYDAIRRAGDPSHDGEDLVSHLVRAADQGLSQWSYENERALRDEVIAFLCAFTDAPTATLCFAFHHLGSNRTARERVEREVAEVLGDRPVEPADLERLPYVEAVLKETLRLEPPAYVMRAKEAVEDRALGGYVIPKGTLMLVGMRVLHWRADYWEHGREFRPERWLSDSGTAGGPPCPEHAYIPFGSGPHGCAGSDLAAMLFVFALATIAQRLRLEPGSSRPPKRENIGVGVDRLRVGVRELAGGGAARHLDG